MQESSRFVNLSKAQLFQASLLPVRARNSQLLVHSLGVRREQEIRDAGPDDCSSTWF